MPENLRVNDKPAVRIKAELIKPFRTSYLMDCEGDNVWFPIKCVKLEKGGTMLIEEWLYNQKVEDGIL